MKNSLTKKLLLAVITLGIAVIATVGSTYAWFSMNTTVEATGMQLTAVTPVNVVISKEENGSYGPSVEFTTDHAKLFPASTTIEQLTSAGVSFWAVEEGQVIGEDGKGGISSSSTKFQTEVKSQATADLSGRSYFIKEDLYLKTTAGKISLVLKEITLGDVTSQALIPSGGTVESAATIGSPATTKAIKNALYVALITDNKTFIYSLDGSTGSFKGVETVASNGTRTIKDEKEELSTVGSAGTEVFDSSESTTIALGTDPQHVRVVVWLEGEDPECENAIGGLGLSIGLVFGYKEGSFIAE